MLSKKYFGKSLDYFIKKTVPFIAATTLTLSSLGILGCEKDKITEPPLEPPSISYIVSHQQGQRPLESRFIVGGEGDIEKYILSIPGLGINIEKNNPIDTSFVFYEIGNYFTKGQVTGYGLSDHKNITINVYDETSPENLPPTAFISANPNQGETPLESRLEVWGEDPNGIEDIVKYVLSIPSVDFYIEQSTPINTFFTFDSSGEYLVKAKVTDTGNLSDSTSVYINVSEPTIPEPFVSHTATLKDFVNIKYEATFENLDELNLLVLRNNETIFEKTITNPDYSKLFTYQDNPEIIKGDYEFILSWTDPSVRSGSSNKDLGRDSRNEIRERTLRDQTGKTKNLESRLRRNDSKNQIFRDNSNTITIEIPNYLPTANFSGISTNFDEGSEISINTEGRFSDINPEDNPVPLRNAQSLDGKTKVIVNNPYITIKSVEDISQNQNYQVEVEFGSEEGGKNTSVISGTIFDLLDIQGFLEDNETHSRHQGIIKVYNSNQNSGPFIKLSEIQVGPNGEFNQKLEHRVQDLQDYLYIQGRIKNPATGEPESYIRTIKLPKGDVLNLLIRPVPYEGLYPLSQHNISPEDFRRHFSEVVSCLTLTNPPSTDPLDWNALLLKWDFGIDPNAFQSFIKVIISKSHYNPNTPGNFSQQTAENIRNRLLDENDAGSIFNGNINHPNQIEIVEDYGEMQIPEDLGKIVIYPELNLISSGTALANDITEDGYLDWGKIRLKVNSQGGIVGFPTFSHELIHVSGCGGHAWTLPSDLTVMRNEYDQICPGPRFADKKVSKLLYEESYLQGTGTNPFFGFTGTGLGTRDVLGLEWLGE